MRPRYILSALVSVAVATMSADAIDATPSGYIERGESMYNAGNYIGCIDHLSKAKDGELSQDNRHMADYYMALASFRTGDDKAIEYIDKFLRDYPSSVYRGDIAMVAGDYYFTRKEYGRALTRYDVVDSRQLNDASAEDYCYRVAYCRMKLAEYDNALDGFGTLTSTKRYGSAARFYQGYIAYATGDYKKAESILSTVDKTSSPGNMADYYLCQIYFSREDYDKALDMARQLVVRDVEQSYKAEAERIAGESLFNLGREDEAKASLIRYVAMCDNPQPSAHYALGVCLYREGKYEQAIEYLSKATNCENKTGQSAYMYLGQSLYRQGAVSAALLALEQASNMGYDATVKENTSYNYIALKAQCGNEPFGRCVEAAELFLIQFPQSVYVPQVREYVVKGLMANNDYERALLCIARYDNPSDEILKDKQRVLFTLATRDVGAGRIKQALTRFAQAREIIPGDKEVAAECNLWIGDCLYREDQYAKASESYLDYLNAIAPSHKNCMLAYYNLGYSRFQQGRYDDAMVNFKRVARNQGSLSKAHVADAYNRIGDCYYYDSQFKQASEYYNKAIEINPSAGDYALYQNALMRGHNRDYKGKIDDLNSVIKQYPSSTLIPLAMLEKADAYTALNDKENAINAYRQLVKKYPSSSQARNALLQLAITYSNAGDNTKAIDAYKEVITSYPNSDEARVAAEDLKRVLADEGRLSEYAGFLKNVPGAPQIDQAEMDQLTFRAAEKSYLNGNGIKSLRQYINDYPQGDYMPQALYYMCQAATEGGNDEQALEYATCIVEQYPQASAVEDALATKADVEYRQGAIQEALMSYTQLEQKAVAPHNVKAALMGKLRVCRDLSMHNEVIDATNRLKELDQVRESELSEICFSRAYALNAIGNHDEAVVEWASLAANPDDINGAKSAYYLAQYYYDKGKLKDSRRVIEALIDANTLHRYWLARGFILLSDINRKEGNAFEADEYLKTLKETYPGSETDIFIMIDQRLK